MTKPWILLIATALLMTSCAIYRARQKNAQAIGELVPCSARVAKEITSLIDAKASPKRILEVGAGSGALTGKIIQKMTEQDHLDLVEIEPILCDVLREKFGSLPNVSIRCMDFLEWQPAYTYDYVVSTLPFNSFPPELVQKLVDQLVKLSSDKALLGFVEFKWLSSVRTIGMKKNEKLQHKKTQDIVKNFYKKYGLYERDVYMNFPPIIVYHLQITKPLTP